MVFRNRFICAFGMFPSTYRLIPLPVDSVEVPENVVLPTMDDPFAICKYRSMLLTAWLASRYRSAIPLAAVAVEPDVYKAWSLAQGLKVLNERAFTLALYILNSASKAPSPVAAG